MDYFFCGVLELRSNRDLRTTKASLMASIKEQSSIMERKLVERCCGSFRTREKQMVRVMCFYIMSMDSQHKNKDLSFCFNEKY